MKFPRQARFSLGVCMPEYGHGERLEPYNYSGAVGLKMLSPKRWCQEEKKEIKRVDDLKNTGVFTVKETITLNSSGGVVKTETKRVFVPGDKRGAWQHGGYKVKWPNEHVYRKDCLAALIAAHNALDAGVAVPKGRAGLRSASAKGREIIAAGGAVADTVGVQALQRLAQVALQAMQEAAVGKTIASFLVVDVCTVE